MLSYNGNSQGWSFLFNSNLSDWLWIGKKLDWLIDCSVWPTSQYGNYISNHRRSFGRSWANTYQCGRRRSVVGQQLWELNKWVVTYHEPLHVPRERAVGILINLLCGLEVWWLCSNPLGKKGDCFIRWDLVLSALVSWIVTILPQLSTIDFQREQIDSHCFQVMKGPD